MLYDYNYVTSELAEKTKYKSIYNAYQKNDLSVVVYDRSAWFLEGGNISDRLFKVVYKEMQRLFPQYTYIGEIGRR